MRRCSGKPGANGRREGIYATMRWKTLSERKKRKVLCDDAVKNPERTEEEKGSMRRCSGKTRTNGRREGFYATMEWKTLRER